jgi:hypothetical protein
VGHAGGREALGQPHLRLRPRVVANPPGQQPPVGAQAEQDVAEHEELEDVAFVAAVLAAAVQAPALHDGAAHRGKGAVALDRQRADLVLQLRGAAGGEGGGEEKGGR